MGEVVKERKKGETYVVEVAEEEDETGKKPPVTVHLRDPETRYLTKMVLASPGWNMRTSRLRPSRGWRL